MTNVAGRRPVDHCACDCRETPSLRLRGAEAARTAVFFGLAFAYVWLWVRPALIYSCGTITNFPVFYRGWAFFHEVVSQPGGLIRYVSAFASQLFYYSWAGAIVIALQAWAICACTGYLLRATKLPGARLLRFAPAIFVLVAYAQYSYHLPLFMAALASLAFASLHVRFTRGRSKVARDLVVFLILATILYLIGAGAVLPFAILCAVCAIACRRTGRPTAHSPGGSGKRQLADGPSATEGEPSASSEDSACRCHPESSRWIRGGLYLLIGLVLPYVVGVLVFRVSIVNAYTDLLPMSWRVLGWPTREKLLAAVYGVYMVAIIGMLVGGLWQVIAARWNHRPEVVEKPVAKPAKGRSPAPAKPRASVFARPTFLWILGTLVLFAAGGAAAKFSLDSEQKAMLEVHDYACRRMWPEVLAAASRCPDNPYALNAVDRALYHTGRLGTDLCRYVQSPENLLIMGDDHVMTYWHAFDTLMDLGLANEAEKNLTECLETFGEQPAILERLAMVNLAKGKTGAARIYLGALQKTLFQKRWADNWLAKLDADPNLAGDVEIQRWQTQCLKRDSIAQFYDREAMLTSLVEQSGGNRMAFEYLMAWHLLKGQLGKVIELIGRLDEFGYTEIPPLWQEAILIYAYGSGKGVDLHGRAIAPEMHQRMQQFGAIVNKHGRDRAGAAAELARDFRGSYFFYYFCTRVAGR